jgi:hypothetical protein
MHLVEIFLPLRDNEGRAFEAKAFARVRDALIERFGGATAFTRAPAAGFVASGGEIRQDDIVVVEVMVPELKRDWWSSYRRRLKRDFRQDEILVRATEVTKL